VDNVLVGLGGNDVLNGLAGSDSMEGGSGDDDYFVDNIGDVVVELSGQGVDRVNSSVDYILTANVEKLNLIRTAISGTGNSLDNLIHGNAEDNILDASSGNDRIFGNAGADTIIGGEGADTLFGGAGSDVFVFRAVSESGDRISDFVSGVDKIALDLTGFVDLAGLALADAFIFGSDALDSDDRLIFDTSNFTLYYDSDGAGGTDKLFLANLNFGASLLHTDFILT
jgi:Ca2+-binding RTX toxin-like protein